MTADTTTETRGATPAIPADSTQMTLTQYLQARATRPSSRFAFGDGATGRQATWGEVAGAADTWTHAAPRGPVGLALRDPLDMAVNLVGGLAAGATIAPLDPTAPGEELTRRVRDLGLRAVITAAGDPRPELAGVERWTCHAGRLVREEPGTPLVRATPATFCRASLIMTSSGTTGPPKIIPLTEAQLVRNAESVARHLLLEPRDVGYSPLPLFHINGIVVGLLSALVAGSSLVVGPFSRRAFWEVVEAQNVTWLNLVPAIFAILTSAEAESPPPISRVRLARSASAPLPPAVAARFEARYGIPVIESYGMTEAASQITANPLSAPRSGSVGLPISVELRVVDTADQPVPPAQVGRVQIRGDRVTRTYWSISRDGSWTRHVATNREGWLTTGDLGRLDSDGYLYLTGREDDVINRGGEKIHPREVEDVLLADPRVIAAAVVARAHPTLGSEPVAYVLGVEGLDGRGQDELIDALLARCESALSTFKRPAEIAIVPSLPSAPVGKVRRAELRQHPPPT